MENALILAGAVAKGAFEAGALDVLAQNGIRFRRVVAASAGSLTASVYAAGARVGRAREAADSLAALWSDYARWDHVFSPSASGLLHLRGLSNTDKVRDLIVEQLAHWLDDKNAPPPSERPPIDLRLAVTLTDGRVEPLGPGRATTFERVLSFDGPALDNPVARQRLISATIASAAFPLVFLPVNLGPDLGNAFDGGAVDNAPIHEAVQGSDIERVFVLSTDPAEIPPIGDASGDALLMRLIGILISERLFRDLDEAYRTNDALDKLDALTADGTLTPAQLLRVREAIGWTDRRKLELVIIRPARALDGGAFSGFFSGDMRREYVRLGREAAEHSLQGKRL